MDHATKHAQQDSSTVGGALRLTLASWGQMFERKSIPKNVAAGITAGLVALPLNLALAIACGLPPHVGLVTGAIAGLLVAFLGATRFQITGPEVALAPITLEIVSRYGFEGLLAATFMAGMMQIAFGAMRLGRFVQAIPVPVIGGFLAAVGLLVFDSQLPRLLGLPAEVSLLSEVRELDVLRSVDASALLLGLLVIGVMFVVPRIAPKAPAPLVALGIAVLSLFVLDISVPTVAPIEGAFAPPRFPTFFGGEFDLMALVPEAIALALLASIDSLLCALSVEARVGDERTRTNQELVAQGLANMSSACFGGMPVAAAVVRSMAAVEAGASTRLAPIVQSVLLLLILLVLAPVVSHIPLFALAAILLVVGYRLINWRQLAQLWHIARFEASVFIVTAAGILMTDFVIGVGIGVVVALLDFARQQRAALRPRVQHEVVASSRRHRESATSDALGGMRILHLHGPLFFGSQDRVDALLEHAERPEAVLVDVSAVSSVDISGAMALANKLKRLSDRGARVWVSAPTDGLSTMMRWALSECDANGVCVLDGLGSVSEANWSATMRTPAANREARRVVQSPPMYFGTENFGTERR